MPSSSLLLAPNSILATSNSTYSDTSGAIFAKVEAVPNFQSASMRSMVPSNFSAASSTNSYSGDKSNALRVEDRISDSIKKKNHNNNYTRTDDRFIPRPPLPPPTSSSSSKAIPPPIRFSLPQNLTLKDVTTTNSPSPRNLTTASPSPRRPKPLNSTTTYNNQNTNLKTSNNNSQDGMVEFSPVVPSPTKSTASLRKKNINDKSIIKKETEDKNQLNQKTQNFLRRMSSSLREKMTVKEQLEYETNAKKELARCIPPKSKSLYQFDLPSSVVRSLVVLQNNTLCRFGGLGHEWMHLLFCKVPVVEGSLPSNWELYTRSCIEHGVEPLEEIRKNLSITPGRFDLKQLHLGCCGSFQDLGVKTILPLIYHNRHVLEDLQIQCAGITDEGLQTLLEALDEDEIPDSTRDNLAIALHPNCRMHRLVANGGHFSDDRLVGGGGRTAASSSCSGGNSPNRGGKNGSSSSPVSPLMPMRSSRNSTKKRDSSITIVDSEAGDDDEDDEINNNNNNSTSLLLSSRIANNINKDASGNILGRDDSPASPKSKGLGDMIKMEKLRSAVRDVIYDGCKNLKRINLSCNTGIVKESSTALLCEFCEDHPSVIFVNVQQTKIDSNKVRKVLLENRDKQMYERRMQVKENNNVDGIASSSLHELDDEDGTAPQIVGSAEFFSCSSQDTLTSRSYHNNNTSSKLKATFNKVNHFQQTTAKNVAAIRKNRHGGYLQPTACMNNNNRQQKANTNSNSRPHSATISLQHQKQQQSALLPPSSTANNTQKNKSSSSNSEDLTTIDCETFKNDVKVFETFMNPYSGMLELSRMASSHPYLVSKISSHILAQRSKVEEKVYNDTVKNATIGGGAGGGTGGGIFSRSKLPLAQIPELAKELRLSASRAAAEIDRNPSLSLETVNFIVYLQAMHPKVPVIEIERAIMKYCELAHADSVTKAQSALESVPMTVTVECLEMFDVLDEDKDGYVTLDDFLRISNSKEGKEAAVFMFERLGLGRVKREEFIPICIPFLTKM